MIGLFNVDNTSDLNKPISNATQTGLDSKLNLVGGTLTGGLVGTTATFSGPITANGGITGTTASFSGPITANGGTLTGGLTGTTATFSGSISANGATLISPLTGTSATFNGMLNATGGLTGSNAFFAGPITTNGGIRAIGGTLTAGLTGTTATFSGAITANGGTLTGALTGTSASFSGPITANGGTLTGGLTGTSASFSGPITANGGTFTSSVTMNFSLNVLGSITAILPHYSTNLEACNAGVPYMGLYRTGGIVKVRLDIVPPTITLLGSSSINLNLNSTYTEPGVTVTDNYDTNLPCYITSISSGSTNALSNSVTVVGTTTTVSQTSTLPVGVYTITYNAYDSSGNIGLNSRTLNIVLPPSYYSFSGTSLANSSAIGYSSNTQFMLGSGDFTIECFVRYQTLPTTMYPSNPTSVLFDLWSTSDGANVIGAGDVTNIQTRFIYNGVGQYFNVITYAGNFQSIFANTPPTNYKITSNVWYHTGFMRINNYMYIIHNGFISRNGGVGSRTDITGYVFNGQRSIRIGNSINLGPITGYLNGDISELRISNIARYSGSGADTYYTVPETLTKDANTIFKLGDNYIDEVSSTVLTNVGTIQATKNYR